MVDRIKRMAGKELLTEAGRNVNVVADLILKHHGIEIKPLGETKESARRMKVALYKRAAEKVLSGEETDRTEEIIDMFLFKERGGGKRGYGRGDEFFGGKYD